MPRDPADRTITNRRQPREGAVRLKSRILTGIYRRRDIGLVAKSSLFDRAWYLEQYRDVQNANIEPVAHYITFGGFEGRNPSPQFNSSWYLEQYPDVREAALNPLVHYLRYGIREGRQPRSPRVATDLMPPMGRSVQDRTNEDNKINRESRGAVRDRYARLLMTRLSAHPRLGCVPQNCGSGTDPGIDEKPEWQIWTGRATTEGQLRIEEQLDNLVEASSSILHIGVGNSSLGRRFASRVSMILGTTLHDEERIFSERCDMKNYNVLTANKFSEDMDSIDGQFDFIVDNNPTGFACCLFHFSRMMICYLELLRRNGGLLLTEQRGLSWVCTGNDPNWSFEWDDWERLGDILRMPARRFTDCVYSMQLLPEGGIAALERPGPNRLR